MIGTTLNNPDNEIVRIYEKRIHAYFRGLHQSVRYYLKYSYDGTTTSNKPLDSNQEIINALRDIIAELTKEKAKTDIHINIKKLSKEARKAQVEQAKSSLEMLRTSVSSKNSDGTTSSNNLFIDNFLEDAQEKIARYYASNSKLSLNKLLQRRDDIKEEIKFLPRIIKALIPEATLNGDYYLVKEKDLDELESASGELQERLLYKIRGALPKKVRAIIWTPDKIEADGKKATITKVSELQVYLEQMYNSGHVELPFLNKLSRVLNNMVRFRSTWDELLPSPESITTPQQAPDYACKKVGVDDLNYDLYSQVNEHDREMAELVDNSYMGKWFEAGKAVSGIISQVALFGTAVIGGAALIGAGVALALYTTQIIRSFYLEDAARANLLPETDNIESDDMPVEPQLLDQEYEQPLLLTYVPSFNNTKAAKKVTAFKALPLQENEIVDDKPHNKTNETIKLPQKDICLNNLSEYLKYAEADSADNTKEPQNKEEEHGDVGYGSGSLVTSLMLLTGLTTTAAGSRYAYNARQSTNSKEVAKHQI